jgi:hypothetical protein
LSSQALWRDEIHIREALPSEIDEIMRQRRYMFDDMGFKDPSDLDAMQHTSEAFIRRAIAERKYHQWFAETSELRIAAGAAILVHP